MGEEETYKDEDDALDPNAREFLEYQAKMEIRGKIRKEKKKRLWLTIGLSLTFYFVFQLH